MDRKQRISYLPLEAMDDEMRAEMERCMREGTPRPESSAVRAHVPACFWAFARSSGQPSHHRLTSLYGNGHGLRHLARAATADVIAAKRVDPAVDADDDVQALPGQERERGHVPPGRRRWSR